MKGGALLLSLSIAYSPLINGCNNLSAIRDAPFSFQLIMDQDFSGEDKEVTFFFKALRIYIKACSLVITCLKTWKNLEENTFFRSLVSDLPMEQSEWN